MSSGFLFFALSAFALITSGCGNHPVMLQGRLAFRDQTGCASPVAGSQYVSWAQCNALKRQFSVTTGLPITGDALTPTAFRPLPATIHLEVFRGGHGFESLFVSCGSGTFVTNANGIYNGRVDLNDNDVSCITPGTGLMIIGTVTLRYRMFTDDLRRSGTVRALWQEAEAYPVLADEGRGTEVDVGEDAYTTMNPDGSEIRFAVPRFAFAVTGKTVPEFPSSVGGAAISIPAINLDTHVFLNRAGDDRYGYLRQMLTGYSNIIHFHEIARSVLGNTVDHFTKMFVNPPEGTIDWGQSYSVYFDNTWAFGNRGSISLLRPNIDAFREDGNHDGNPDGSWGAARLISQTDVVSHEFGHSLANGYARYGVPFDYSFAGQMMHPDGSVYNWGHGGWQHAEMGAVMQEGVANALGQYLLNRCNGWVSGIRPNTIITDTDRTYWNTGGIWNQDTSCDTTVEACGYHHTRWYLRSNEGLSESSMDFSNRSARVGALVSLHMANHGNKVMSNNEARVGEWVCDLLDTDNSVGHASSISSSYTYVPNYTYWVAEYLNGATDSLPLVRNYSASAAAENINLSLGQILQTFGNFCPDCAAVPGGGAWGHDYNRRRLSVSGDISPQSFARYIETQGWADHESLNNAFRTNFMDEF